MEKEFGMFAGTQPHRRAVGLFFCSPARNQKSRFLTFILQRHGIGGMVFAGGDTYESEWAFGDPQYVNYEPRRGKASRFIVSPCFPFSLAVC